MAKIRKPILSPERLKLVDVNTEQASLFIEGVLAKNIDIEKKKIDELNINTCMVEDSSLLSSVFNEIKIIDSILKKCDFTGVVAHHTSFDRMHISNSRLQGSQFMESSACDVVIERSKCVDVSFRFGKITHTAFIDCDLSGADFLGAHLKNVIFRNCNLKKSQFSQSKLNQVSFKGSDIEDIAISKECFVGITVNTGQALYLASMLGFTVED